jgi:dipeptidyl aminopeptidase/acylaminoacyl peptidase
VAPAGGIGGGQLVFQSEMNGKDEEIYRVDLDKLQSPVNLTRNIAKDVSPAWSPNGATIAFSSDRAGASRIFLMDADGSNQRQFLPGGPGGEANPQFCDDVSVVFGASGDVWVAEYGGTARNLTNSSGFTESQPACTPDGTRVLFQSSASTAGRTVYDLPASGVGTPRQLTPDGWLALDPAIDPSGKELLFFGQSPDGKRGLWENTYLPKGTSSWNPKLVLEAKPPREFRLTKHDAQFNFAWTPTFRSRFASRLFGTDLPAGSGASTGTRSIFEFRPKDKAFFFVGYEDRFGEDANPAPRPFASVYQEKKLVGIGGTRGIDAFSLRFGKDVVRVTTTGPLAEYRVDGVVEPKKVVELPLKYRHALDLLLLDGNDRVVFTGQPASTAVKIDCGNGLDNVNLPKLFKAAFKNCEKVKRT